MRVKNQKAKAGRLAVLTRVGNAITGNLPPRAGWALCGFVLCLLLSLLASAQAQDSLIVNGRSVDGLSRTIVPGQVYAPADLLAAALGADYSYDPDSGFATFNYAAALLSVRVFSDAGAASAPGALALNGAARPGSGGLLRDGQVYVPVRAVSEAFGGRVDVSGQTVIAVFPRAELTNAYVMAGDAAGSYERIVLEFDGLVPFESYTNLALNTLQLRFETASADGVEELRGGYLERAVIDPSAGYLDVTVRPRSGYRFESYTAPRPGGTSVFIDIVPDGAAASGALNLPASSSAAPGQAASGPAPGSGASSRLIVIDPAHGGSDPGLAFSAGSEGELSLRFAQQLAARLEARGYRVELTRADNTALPVAQRAALGVTADLFLSVHAADLTPSQLNVYYLGDAAQQPSLDLAVRENAAAAAGQADLNALRRRLLLQLVPDLATGAAYAQGISDELLRARGYRSNLSAAPLAVLEGAGGRGLLLELNASDLSAGEQLAETLADAISTVLSRVN